MKRIIIIFIIAICLLSFTEISYLAKEHPIAGEVWNGLTRIDSTEIGMSFSPKISDTLKNIYLQGITGGFILSGAITGIIELSNWNNFIIQNREAIKRVMDELYKDPANIHIDWCLICLVACRKLKGEDVEQLLRDYRKFAYQKYQRVIEE
ncbi:hypothetical protein ES695_05045 [Candidatus Atribacteria bacterium 1244-E10-H5-B2]|nr:MAG: hypothetical protein ES695_05045 [Candidatus Atribacteria bacterium 1244-E10-H5-B2]